MRAWALKATGASAFGAVFGEFGSTPGYCAFHCAAAQRSHNGLAPPSHTSGRWTKLSLLNRSVPMFETGDFPTIV